MYPEVLNRYDTCHILYERQVHMIHDSGDNGSSNIVTNLINVDAVLFDHIII